jgi:hypothetical protein
MLGSRSLVSTSADDNDMTRKPSGWNSEDSSGEFFAQVFRGGVGEDAGQEQATTLN